MLRKEYKTVLKRASAQIEEKKSKFICNVMPVEYEEQAIRFIDELRTKYWDETHNVYAYYIEGETTAQRYSDDGEPSGTAGMPVLEAIKKAGVINVAVVVTRYFGGTLLGAAGLIRAYGKSAMMGLNAAVIVKKQLCTELIVTMEYVYLGKVQNLIISEGYNVKSTEYGQDAEMTLLVPADMADGFTDKLIEATNANILVQKGRQEYIMLDEKGRWIKDN